MTGFSFEEQETIIRIPKKGDEFFIYTNRPEHYKLISKRCGDNVKVVRREMDAGREISWDMSLPLTFLSRGSLGVSTEKRVERTKAMAGTNPFKDPVNEGA